MSTDNVIAAFSEEELADKPNLHGLRKRLLESALVYYQEFIDQRSRVGVHVTTIQVDREDTTWLG